MKRRLLIIAICLLLGAVVNVAVAWGCATWSALEVVSVSLQEPTKTEQHWWRQIYPTRAAPEALLARQSSGFGCDSQSILGDRGGQAVFRVDSASFTTVNFNVNAKFDRVTTLRSGWPWRSGAGERWDLGFSLITPIPTLGYRVTMWRDADLHSFAWSFDRPEWLGSSSFRILPLRPVWPGFAVNTLFYAALLWSLICSPFALRRFLRLRIDWCGSNTIHFDVAPDQDIGFDCGSSLTGWRSLLVLVYLFFLPNKYLWIQPSSRCPRCGYQLRSDFSQGCPECGWRREANP